jgi:hypothetical protein
VSKIPSFPIFAKTKKTKNDVLKMFLSPARLDRPKDAVIKVQIAPAVNPLLVLAVRGRGCVD